MATVRVFRYIEDLDAFLVTKQYQQLADYLGISEWNPVVWIGRLFTLDNDYGEHWFDNWKEREARAERAAEFGIDHSELLVLAHDCFADGKDGPCHSPEVRRQFWTDVLKSLELSEELLFAEARLTNAHIREVLPDEYLEDLEERIHKIQSGEFE